MVLITISSPKTVQTVATKYTGAIANAPKLMTLNRLTSQNLVTGQKVIIPDTMLTPVYQSKVAALKSGAPANKNTMILAGLAAVAGLWYLKSKGKLKLS